MQIGAVEKGQTVQIDLLQRYKDAGFTAEDDGYVIHIYLNGAHVYVVNHGAHNVAQQELAYAMGLLYCIWSAGYEAGANEVKS